MLLKVVYDTNVIVSAILKPGSVPASVVTLGIERHVRLCLSPELLEEYTLVLQRPKFGLQPRSVETFLDAITRGAFRVHPKVRITAALDAGDNHVLECAVAASADYLVTGNTKHFPVHFQHTAIVTPAEFALRLLE